MSTQSQNEFMEIFKSLKNGEEGPGCGRDAAVIATALILIEGRLSEISEKMNSATHGADAS